MRYFILNKPPGCITGRSDPDGRATVYDHVPAHFPPLPHVGRLDFNTEGLLLFTDDGRLARGLLTSDLTSDLTPKPVPKTYHLKVRPRLEPGDPRIVALEAPLPLPGRPGEFTRPACARWLSFRTRSAWLEVVIDEGRHHQVRDLAARAGLQLVKLRRVALGPLTLGELKPRWCRPLAAEEVRACYAWVFPDEIPPVPEPLP